MVQVNIGGRTLPAAVRGTVCDSDWDGRESKAVTLQTDYATAAALFADGAAWSIATEQETFDNSAFCVAGDITDHRNGSVTVKMGKLTALEETLWTIYGGEHG